MASAPGIVAKNLPINQAAELPQHGWKPSPPYFGLPGRVEQQHAKTFNAVTQWRHSAQNAKVAAQFLSRSVHVPAFSHWFDTPPLATYRAR
eukprot:4543244-Amphidinium_carterae.1